MTRRRALTNALAALAALPLARRGDAATLDMLPAQTASPNLVYEHDLPDVNMHNWHVHVSYVNLAPGSVGKPHRHPGFVLAYVLKGAVITKISGQEQKTYRAGEMFYEPPGSVHEVSRNASASEPAQLLALILAPKGEPLVRPA